MSRSRTARLSTSTRARTGAAVAVVAVLLGVGLGYPHLQTHTRRLIAWRDITAELGPVRWPVQVVSIIRTREKFQKILANTIPKGTPSPPAVDYRRSEAILIALRPRSS